MIYIQFKVLSLFIFGKGAAIGAFLLKLKFFNLLNCLLFKLRLYRPI